MVSEEELDKVEGLVDAAVSGTESFMDAIKKLSDEQGWDLQAVLAGCYINEKIIVQLRQEREKRSGVTIPEPLFKPGDRLTAKIGAVQKRELPVIVDRRYTEGLYIVTHGEKQYLIDVADLS